MDRSQELEADAVHEIAERCLQLFDQLEPLFASRPADQLKSFNESRHVFQLWSDTLAPLSSLSWRLSNMPSIRISMVQLLSLMEDNLNRLLELESTDGTPTTLSGKFWPKLYLQAFNLFYKHRTPDTVGIRLACLSGLWNAADGLRDLMVVVPNNPQDKHIPQHTLDPASVARLLRSRGLLKSRYPYAKVSLIEILVQSLEKRRKSWVSSSPGLGPISRLSASLRNVAPLSAPLSNSRSSSSASSSDSGTPEAACRQIIEYPEPPLDFDLDQRAWRQALVEDLKPFICLFEECERQVAFSSVREWSEHMEVAHSTEWIERVQLHKAWYCDIDQLTEGDSSTRPEFLSAIELECHVNSSHKDLSVPNVAMRFMLENNVVMSAGDPSTCPLCGPVADPHDAKRCTPGHIARHLKFLAFRFLTHYLEETTQHDSPHASQDDTNESNHDISSVIAQQSNITPGSAGSTVSQPDPRDQEPENNKLESRVGTNVPMQLPPSGHRLETKPTNLRMLRRCILESRVKSPLEERYFLPKGSLKKLVTDEYVRMSLPGSSENTIAFIIDQAPKLFAILVCIRVDLDVAISSLLEHELTDKFLPISKETVDDNCEEDRFNRSCKHASPLDVFHREPWDYSTLLDLYEKQWEFLAPVFELEPDSFPELQLHSRSILPFVGLEENRKAGGFSDVYKVKIHPDHLSLLPNSRGEAPSVALKKVRIQSDSAELAVMFNTEKETLKQITASKSNHILTPLATIEHGQERYVVFPWADGGDLRQFWADDGIVRPPTKGFILEVLEQLRGLAHAVQTLHRRGLRHGDVKPENILRFGDSTAIGDLRLTDMGLVSHHTLETRLRSHGTATVFATPRYQAPEMTVSPDQPVSRRYDVWSLGCIYLEFMAWLLYDDTATQPLQKLMHAIVLTIEKLPPVADLDFVWDTFYAVERENGVIAKVCLHHAVAKQLDLVLYHPRCGENTALGDLALLVKTKMLVELPGRATSDEVLTALTAICEKSRKIPSYIFPVDRGQHLTIPTHPTGPVGMASGIDLSSANAAGSEDAKLPEDKWEFIIDNDFAQGWWDWNELTDRIRPLVAAVQDEVKLPRLCAKCALLDISDPTFKITYNISYLEERINYCGLCHLLHKAGVSSGIRMHSQVQFTREKSILRIGESGPPVLSIMERLGQHEPPGYPPRDIQLGFPLLLPHLNPVSVSLMKYWLRTCDMCHECAPDTLKALVPTRLLEIDAAQRSVRIRQTSGMNPDERYMALSFAWGSGGPANEIFRTMTSNLLAFERGIQWEQVSKTFQDAIAVASSLGIRYLWIDSLCIIQDQRESWEHEVRKMDGIFRQAYCTLSASSAQRMSDGFVAQRKRQDLVQLNTVNGRPQVFLCELIDNFQRDVEESILHSRGWVLPERVFSRRIIFFTSSQIYWQCGEGIRCETMTKLSHPMANMLGDPDFPRYALERYNYTMTFIYQTLYRHASRLKLTYESDRWVSMSALEARLLRGFQTRGGYGIFEADLGRSLLWRRGSPKSLAPISFHTSGMPIPSWSSMANTGEIDYLDLPRNGVTWNKAMHLIYQRTNSTSDGEPLPTELVVDAFEYNGDKVTMKHYDLYPDREEGLDQMMCIVVGQSREAKPEAHYLLFIIPRVGEGHDGPTWQRAGVGLAEGDGLFRLPEDKPVNVRIL